MLHRPDHHSTPPPGDGVKLLRFAASFLWADLELAPTERAFLLGLASELDVDRRFAATLLRAPPRADDVDPGEVAPQLADAVRRVALRAIAADGRVDAREMRMFELLDALLPGRERPPS